MQSLIANNSPPHHCILTCSKPLAKLHVTIQNPIQNSSSANYQASSRPSNPDTLQTLRPSNLANGCCVFRKKNTLTCKHEKRRRQHALNLKKKGGGGEPSNLQPLTTLPTPYRSDLRPLAVPDLYPPQKGTTCDL